MKKTSLFGKKELEKLPFNYQYILKTENIEPIAETENKFSPFREIAIDALHTSKHLTYYPQKVISKIFLNPTKNGKK